MLRILEKFFGNKGKQNEQNFTTKLKEKTSASRKSLSPLDTFCQEAREHGELDYPFLSKDYSPNSRVPSIDLSPFIIERLRNHDVDSIIALMREILSSNPGLGIGPEWIDKEIKEIIEIEFDKYLQFANPDHYNQLKAMWIVASKGGGGREFWIADDIPQLFSWAMCCNLPVVQPSISRLVDKANRFISKVAKDTPYWEDYPKFSRKDVIISPVERLESVTKKVQKMSIAARLHLFHTIGIGGGSLPTLTNHAIRSFGISVRDTSSQILKSELFIPSLDPDSLSNSMSKQELLDVCVKAVVEVRKSWDKSKLAHALSDGNSKYFEKLMDDMNVVSINPEYESNLNALNQYAKKLNPVFKALCFI